MTFKHQFGVNRLTASAAACAPVRQSHKGQSYVSLFFLGHKERIQQLDNALRFSRHSDPRVAGVYTLVGLAATPHMILKRALFHQSAKTLNRLFTSHRYLNHQTVRWINKVIPARRRDVTNRNTTLAIK